MDRKSEKWPNILRDELLPSSIASLMRDLTLGESTLRTAREIGAFAGINNPIWRDIQSIRTILPVITAADLGLKTSVFDSVMQAQKFRSNPANIAGISDAFSLSGLFSRSAFEFLSPSLKANVGLALDTLFAATPPALAPGFAAAGLGDELFRAVRALDLGTYQQTALSDFALGASALATLRDLGKMAGISDRILAQQQLLATAFSGFTQQLAASAFPSIFAAAGLSTASALVEQAAASFAEVVQFPEDDGHPDETVEPNVFSSLYASIYNEVATAEPDIERLAGAVPAQLAQLALEIVLLWDEIAMLSETSTGELIFKPTRKAVMVSGRLGLVVVSSREDFDRLAEDLYFYLYEASAAWTRVTAYVPEFPKVAARLKHFRLYRAHDTQHGKEREIARKAQQVGDHLKELTGKRLPATAGDWQRAQIGLLSEVASFLRQLRDAIIQAVPQA